MKSVILVNDNSNRKGLSSRLDPLSNNSREWPISHSINEPCSHSGLSSVSNNHHLSQANNVDTGYTYHHHQDYHHTIANEQSNAPDHDLEGSILRFLNPPSTSASYNLIKSENLDINNHRSYPNLSTAVKHHQVCVCCSLGRNMSILLSTIQFCDNQLYRMSLAISPSFVAEAAIDWANIEFSIYSGLFGSHLIYRIVN